MYSVMLRRLRMTEVVIEDILDYTEDEISDHETALSSMVDRTNTAVCGSAAADRKAWWKTFLSGGIVVSDLPDEVITPVGEQTVDETREQIDTRLTRYQDAKKRLRTIIHDKRAIEAAIKSAHDERRDHENYIRALLGEALHAVRGHRSNSDVWAVQHPATVMDSDILDHYVIEAVSHILSHYEKLTRGIADDDTADDAPPGKPAITEVDVEDAMEDYTGRPPVPRTPPPQGTEGADIEQLSKDLYGS